MKHFTHQAFHHIQGCSVNVHQEWRSQTGNKPFSHHFPHESFEHLECTHPNLTQISSISKNSPEKIPF